MYYNDFKNLYLHLDEIKKVVENDIPNELRRSDVGKEQLNVSKFILSHIHVIENILQFGCKSYNEGLDGIKK